MAVEKYIKKFAAAFIFAIVAVLVCEALGLYFHSAWLWKLAGRLATYFLELLGIIMCLGLAAFAVALWRDKV